MDAPAGIQANLAIARQNVALSLIKQSHKNDQQLVKILDEAADNTALSASGRGSAINIRV